jgi:hypothetical protein
MDGVIELESVAVPVIVFVLVREFEPDTGPTDVGVPVAVAPALRVAEPLAGMTTIAVAIPVAVEAALRVADTETPTGCVGAAVRLELGVRTTSDAVAFADADPLKDDRGVLLALALTLGRATG